MNKTYCDGKFVFKDTRTEAELKQERKELKEIENRDKKRKVSAKTLKLRKDAVAFNTKVRKAVFRYLSVLGYEPYDVEVGNGYFIFDMGEGAVVHFKLKGFWLKDYQFGMWIHYDNYIHKDLDVMNKKEIEKYNAMTESEREYYDTVIEFFQQHSDYINKFKPSRSSPSISISKRTLDIYLFKGKVKKDYQWSFELGRIESILKFMKNHPFLHFAGLLTHGKRLVECINSFVIEHPIVNFIMERTRFKFNKLVKNIKRLYGLKKAIRICKGLANEDCVNKVEMTSFDCIMPDCSTSYEYEIRMSFKDGYSCEEYSNAFDRHVKRSRIVEIDAFQCVAEIQLSQVDLPIVKSGKSDENEKNKYLLDFKGRKDEYDDYDKFKKWYSDRKKMLKSDKQKNSKKESFECFCNRVYSYNVKTRKYFRTMCEYDKDKKVFDTIEFENDDGKWEKFKN